LSLNFGESGFNCDNWKGAFSFGFEVDVYKGEKSFKYALNVKNLSGTVEFKFYKVLSKEQLEANSSFLNKPIEGEFSAYEMKILDNFFMVCFYLLVIFSTSK
jgi:hypothetical protein